jgi:hypothetical protein
MKIINTIFKILASICMILFITIMSTALLWILFDSSREWMVVMPTWARFIFLIFILGFSSFLTYTDYLRLRKEQ